MGAEPGAARILYIDDDPGIARLVQRHLERCGFTVTVAANGDDGVSLAAQHQFDAIALDHYMPGRDGLDVLAALRGMAVMPPVIFVTGAEEPRIAVHALKNGAADYVVKDVHGTFIELLAASLAQEITRARLQLAKEAAEQELRESRDRLEKLAAQQSVLLREVNHRVANSLQLIISIIEMQARKLPDATARTVLRQAADRVEAVALVHRRLYTSSDVSYVDMSDYLAGLAEELARAAHTGEDGRRVEVRAVPVRLETDRAVSLGLVVNELVTNALKYAYPLEGRGIVRVILDHDADGRLRLVVEDDGSGYAPDAAARGSGVGSMIVSAMARAAVAEVARDEAFAGTRWVVTLAAPPEKVEGSASC
jgi:two-component sensor histidine kinase